LNDFATPRTASSTVRSAAADGDSIALVGYAAGTTFTRVGPGSSNLYKIDDHGAVEFVTIYATGQVHGTDYELVTVYDYNFM